MLQASIAAAELVPVESDPNTFRDIQFVEQTALNSSEFEITRPGAYSVTLIDYAFPQAFEELAVAITDAAATYYVAQLRRGEDPVSIFDVTFDAAGLYVASVFASLDPNAGPGVGLYSLDLQLIPLPGAIWLFASGALLLGGVARRRRR